MSLVRRSKLVHPSFLGGVSLIITCQLTSLATADTLHFVRATQRIVLRDRTIIPEGGEIPVRYDAGSDWVPYYVVSAPSIPKSSAVLVREIIFDRPVSGVVNQLTSVYERTRYPNSIASHIIPNSTGQVISAGTDVRIFAIIGDFYLVNSAAVPNGFIPTSSVTTDPSALASGKDVSAPPAAPSSTPDVTAPNTHLSTLNTQLFGRLKVPYTFENRLLSAGDYIILQYDAGDEWIVEGRTSSGSHRISKAAVSVVDHIAYPTPLSGRIISPTPVFKYLPDVLRDPTTLDQREIFAGSNPTVNVGDSVYISAREGDDYVIEIAGRTFNGLGRVPIRAVRIVSGDPNSGMLGQVPPLP